MDKAMVHIYDGILFSHENEWNWVIFRDMDGPRVCHTAWSKSETEQNIIYEWIYVEYAKKMVLMILFAKQK